MGVAAAVVAGECIGQPGSAVDVVTSGGERGPVADLDQWRLIGSYEVAVGAHLPEATRLASTVQTSWSAILVALLHDASPTPAPKASNGWAD